MFSLIKVLLTQLSFWILPVLNSIFLIWVCGFYNILEIVYYYFIIINHYTPSASFPRNEKEDGILELYYLSAYFLPKILFLQLVGHQVIQISRVFRGFFMLQLLYQFSRSRMDLLNIPLGSLVLAILCGIHSHSALGITSSSGWNSSQNPTPSPTSLPLTVSRTSIEIEWFHVLSSIGYSSPFISLFPISVSINSQY
uniref:Cytochrome c biogenesis B n=1 Tax=Solanum lycopersicum TaxID=4081 RepID=A0A3Q7IUH1_SOLLC